MKAVILARVSTKRQEKEGLSLKEVQLPVLRAYSKDKGFELSERDEFVFQESADAKIRVKFNEMIEYVKKHNDIRAIITFRVDRITRNFRDAVALDELRSKYGVELHFVNDRLIITKDTVGRDIQDWDFKVFWAKQTINRLKEDERISRKTKLENGELPGPAPFGYRNITLENKKKWVEPDDSQAMVVRKIFEWYASENYSVLEISRKLRKEFRINKSKSMVHFILNNKFYIGFITNGGIDYPHRYEQIISQDIFDKAQAIMNKRNGNNKRFKYAGKEFAYRGLMRCLDCDCQITPETKKRRLIDKTFNYHTYYHCTNYFHTHGKVKNVKESDIDNQFIQLFEHLHIPKNKVEEITQSLNNQGQVKKTEINQQLNKLITERRRLKTRTNTAYEDRLNGSITIETFEEIRKKNENDEAELNKRIAKIERMNKEYFVTTAHLVKIAARASEIFKRSKAHEKRALLNLVLQNLKLDKEIVRYTVKFPFDDVLKYAPRSAWLPG